MLGEHVQRHSSDSPIISTGDHRYTVREHAESFSDAAGVRDRIDPK
jgi:hypothetical protein